MMVLFLILSVCVILVGFFYYDYQRKSLISGKQLELSAITDLKIRQISQWRLERLGDGKFFAENSLMANELLEYIIKPSDAGMNSDLLQTLKSLAENFDYKNVLLLDRAGNVILSYPVQDTLIGDYLKSLLPVIRNNHKVILTDLHRAGVVNFVHLDLIVPLIDKSKNDTLVLGMLTFRIDPAKVLYPLIQSWPTPSKTSETLLVRRDGDSIVYLNELRHLKGTELLLRKPLSNEKLAASMALRGITGTVDAEDYRGTKVIAAMKKVPGTTWYMVAKTDRAEVLEVLKEQVSLIIIIIVLIITTSGLSMGFVIRKRRERFYREKYEAEVERLALVKHFDYILKYANDIIFLIDSDLTIVEANDCALKTYMYTRDEIIGMKLSNIRAPEALSQLHNQYEIITENESATFETWHRRRDDSVFPVEISSRMVNIEGLKYYQTIGRNITERKLADITLKESEEKFRKIFEESPFSMVLTGKDFGIVRANMSFCKMIGYNEEELRGFTFRNFTHQDYINDNEVGLLRLVAGEIPVYHTQKQYIRKDGAIIWGSTTVSIIRNNKEEVQLFLAMVEDITSRKEAEKALEKSYSLVKATLESTADGILVVDMDGKIVQLNQKFTDMWMIPTEILDTGSDSNALGYVKDQLLNPASFLENVHHLYDEPEAITLDLLEFKDGRYFERYSQPQKIGGKIVGRVWSFRDITEKKNAERELIAAKEKAEESDRLKTAFLHNVSHEIRTPMNAIQGFSTLLTDQQFTEEELRQYIGIISQSSNQLLSIINDIVDIANVEAGQVKINTKEFNLNLVLLGLLEQFSYQAKEHNIRINLNSCLSDEESDIRADETKVIQILSNLINNSLKFTRNGQIDLGYNLKDNFLEFSVRDTGIGIAPEHLERIFNRFYQVDGADSREYGGTGLGLSICKAYVEILGGTIRVESEQGCGTTFTFTLPYVPARAGRIPLQIII
jgi:PAS domain S-box-containing protein